MQLVFACIAVTAGSQSAAHTSVVPIDGVAVDNQRAVHEGAIGFASAINISHGCEGASDGESRPVNGQSIVFPNGPHALAIRADTAEVIALNQVIEGRSIMSPVAIQDRSIFRTIELKRGPSIAPLHEGAAGTDVRALHFSHGFLQSDLVGRVPFTANFPKFLPNSCAVSLSLRFAIANYCSYSHDDADRADIWMGIVTEKFNDESVISTGYWPTLKVVRDRDLNPLPEECGDGFEVTVEPAVADIDEYLPLDGYWPAQGGFDPPRTRK